MRIATASVRTGLAMTSFFARSAIQSRAGRPGGRPLRKRNKGCNGRATARVAPTEGYKECLAGGRTEASAPTGGGIDGAVCGGTHGSRPTGRFCRAGPACPAGDAGKTRSGRCRHRPLRKRNKRCNGRATARVAPTEGYKECLAGGRTGASAPTGGVLMVPYAAGHMGSALQGVFVGQGPRALPGVRYKVGGRGL